MAVCLCLSIKRSVCNVHVHDGGTPCFQNAVTTDIVNCNETRPFWISWEGGSITLGSGARVGRNTILDYQHDDPYDVTMATLSTGFGSSGIWVLSQPEGQRCKHVVAV